MLTLVPNGLHSGFPGLEVLAACNLLGDDFEHDTEIRPNC
jgi:hypothetical protein